MADPQLPPAKKPECTDTAVVPAADLLLGALAVVATTAVEIELAGDDGPANTSAGVAIVGGGLALGFIGSGVIGFRRMGRCSEAQNQWATRGIAAR